MKGFTLIIEELKQKITAKVTNIQQYDNRKSNNFKATGWSNQGRFFKNLEGKEERKRQTTEC